MANYVMQIGSSLTFDITPKFFPRMKFNWKRSGHEVSVIDTVPVEGWFSENDPDVLLAKWNLLRGIALSGAPNAFYFKKSTGEIIYSYLRGHIQNLESVEQGGGFVNHIQFRFDIEEERGVTFSGLVDVSRSDEDITTIDADGKRIHTVRREVSATGQHGDLAKPRNFVLAQRPSAKNMTRENIREVSYDGVVTGIWEYDATEEEDKGEPGYEGIRLWRERINNVPGTRGHRFYRTEGAPVLLRGGLGESTVNVDGHVEAYDYGVLIMKDTESWLSCQGMIQAATEIVTDRFEHGMPYPLRYRTDQPTVPYIWGLDYSYSLIFGEEGPDDGIHQQIDVKFAGSQGAEGY